ncbi:MAG: hypothetical protein ABEI39_01730 [Halobacteriales archaeon]
MATETADPEASHRRGVKVTAVATLGGVLGGLATASIASGAGDRIGLAVAGLFVLLELAVMRLLGIEVMEFSAKDNLYVVFMSLTLWFITWTVLLTTGVDL